LLAPDGECLLAREVGSTVIIFAVIENRVRRSVVALLCEGILRDEPLNSGSKPIADFFSVPAPSYFLLWKR